MDYALWPVPIQDYFWNNESVPQFLWLLGSRSARRKACKNFNSMCFKLYYATNMCIQNVAYVSSQVKMKLSATAMQATRGRGDIGSYSFLTLAIDGDARSESRPGRPLPRYPLYRRLAGPQSSSVHRRQMKNPLPLPRIEPRKSSL
jgi:hypothetical protein